jgi:hypothetical protein
VCIRLSLSPSLARCIFLCELNSTCLLLLLLYDFTVIFDAFKLDAKSIAGGLSSWVANWELEIMCWWLECNRNNWINSNIKAKQCVILF